ncbi:MAG: hypothetical protein JWP20_1371, partial [Roseomonas sp.]|nr:hypothetical protein [Roseomonas sp.]
PGASLKNAIALAAASEVATIKGQVGKTIAKVGASDATLASMITGEVGKLMGKAVQP